MSEPMTPKPTKASKKRRGVVLIAVLVVVASLSLLGYHYSDMMTSEYKASNNAHKTVQARKFAESGIYYAAAMLSNPDNYDNVLGGNPWNNPGAFQGIVVQGDNNVQGSFSIIAPPDLDDSDLTTPFYGVTDEGGKINLNALMKGDVTGKTAHDMLVLLPNMTEEIANNIVAWMGGTVGIQNGGAQDDYYRSQTPAYRCKNGPIDSVDELLLVKGVTSDLLYGSDGNRNGSQDNNAEANGPFGTGFDRGWSAYLTIHSRRQNVTDPTTGVAYVYLNNPAVGSGGDMTQISAALSDGQLSDDMVKFIIMYRQYPSSSAPPAAAKGAPAPTNAALGSYQPTLTRSPINDIKSIYDLVNKWISITTTDPNDKKKTFTKVYSSPLNDPDQLRDQLPKLLALATVDDPAVKPELAARININTAPRAVLACIPGLSATDVDNIATTRPAKTSSDPPDEIFNTPTWLLTEAKLSLAILKKIEPYITTRSQVYRVQSVGYFGDKGAAIRLEAVVDTNNGRPRIIAWRDLSELGKGWNENIPPPSP